jgi:hypothetical protein
MCGRKTNARERNSELSVSKYDPSHRTQRSFHFLIVGFEMSSTAVSYSFVFPRRFEVVVGSGRSSVWARAGVQASMADAELFRLEWRIVIAYKEGTGRSFVGPFLTN